jgi:hypothetical protein
MSLFGCSPGAMPEWMKRTGQRLVVELPVFIPFEGVVQKHIQKIS